MAMNSCVKYYSFCVEWTTEIPTAWTPRRSPKIILLEGIECNLELTLKEEYYLLKIQPKAEEWEVLNNFTVTTFEREFSHSQPKLIQCRQITFYDKGQLWQKSKLEVLDEIPNIFEIGKLTIVCVFRPTNTDSDKKHSDPVSRQITLNSGHLHSLSRDFSTLLKDESFSDVKLICGDRTFSANSSVLAVRSDVFAAMFRNKMTEAKTGVIHIKDMDPEVLEPLLKYLYCAEIPDLCQETAHRLYEAADKYAIHSLRQVCSDWMVENQTINNCLDLLLLGDKHSDENFKEAVACFIAEHLADLAAYKCWSTFRNNYPLLALPVLEKRCEDSIPGISKRAKTDFQ